MTACRSALSSRIAILCAMSFSFTATRRAGNPFSALRAENAAQSLPVLELGARKERLAERGPRVALLVARWHAVLGQLCLVRAEELLGGGQFLLAGRPAVEVQVCGADALGVGARS